jgi:hypothetical protein
MTLKTDSGKKPLPPVQEREAMDTHRPADQGNSETSLQKHGRQLDDRYRELGTLKETAHRLARGFTMTGIALFTVSSGLLTKSILYHDSGFGVAGLPLLMLSLGLFILSQDYRAQEQRFHDEWKQAELNCDLFKLNPSDQECKAEKMLSNNDSQLRNYYELNLGQCSKIFWVGIFCLCAGAGVIAVTLYAIKNSTDEGHTKIIIGAVGSIGTILINYVAAIFLKMHSAILTILKEFQSKLVGTQELYLANVLSSRISDLTARDLALKEISIEMVKNGRENFAAGERHENDARAKAAASSI